MNLAPPGIDELLGVLEIVGLAGSGSGAFPYDLVIVDTAPTGHALRLLEMPDTAREWIQALLRVLLKYRTVLRPGPLASELVDLSKSVRGLQQQLRDPGHTRFIVVTRAADVPRLETERLVARLHRLQLATPVLVVNALTRAPGRCPRCRAVAAAERIQIAALARKWRRRDCAMILSPLAAPPPRGAAALEGWAERWTRVGET